MEKYSKPFVTSVLLGADSLPLKATPVLGRHTGPELIHGSIKQIQDTSLNLICLAFLRYSRPRPHLAATETAFPIPYSLFPLAPTSYMSSSKPLLIRRSAGCPAERFMSLG